LAGLISGAPQKPKLNFSPYSNHAITLKNFLSPRATGKNSIVYSVELKGLKVTGAQLPIVAFEKSGKDGKRYALRGMNTVVQLTEAELKSSVFPEGYKFPF
jgi:hypothetical protein